MLMEGRVIGVMVIIVCFLVGLAVVALFTTDVGSDLVLGCGSIVWLVCIGAAFIALVAVFAFGCALVLA